MQIPSVRHRFVAVATAGLLALAGCSTQTDGGASSPGTTPLPTPPPTMSSSMSGHMGHQDGGPVPAGMKPASDPKFPVGSSVVLTADHMPGMKGARATVVGAYATFTYAVDYTPTTGGAMVKDHKWVVQEEIKDAGTKRLPIGTHVTLTADHMSGMKGASATIAGATSQTVYVVDFDANGQTIKNHKWVVEGEMRPAP